MIAILGLILWLAVSPVTLKVYPQAGIAPLAVRITVTVEPNDLNRQLCIEWVSEQYSGSSCQTVDGEHFPRTTNKVVALASGEYTFVATVQRVDGTTVSSFIARVEVL